MNADWQTYPGTSGKHQRTDGKILVKTWRFLRESNSSFGCDGCQSAWRLRSDNGAWAEWSESGQFGSYAMYQIRTHAAHHTPVTGCSTANSLPALRGRHPVRSFSPRSDIVRWSEQLSPSTRSFAHHLRVMDGRRKICLSCGVAFGQPFRCGPAPDNPADLQPCALCHE